jgi:hypothetical protein
MRIILVSYEILSIDIHHSWLTLNRMSALGPNSISMVPKFKNCD